MKLLKYFKFSFNFEFSDKFKLNFVVHTCVLKILIYIEDSVTRHFFLFKKNKIHNLYKV